MVQLMPLPLTVSCFSKIQIGFTFLVLAYLGSPRKRAVKRVCVCALYKSMHSLTACSLSCVMDSHHLPGTRKVVWIHCYQNQRTFDVAFKPKSKCQRNQCNINRYSIKNSYTLCFINCQIFMNTWNCMIITLITVTSIYPPDKHRCYQCNVRVDGRVG